jgi:pimeloyl-ACP methyl ester carboxylesterase
VKRILHRHRLILFFAGGVLLSMVLGFGWLTYQEKLDPQSFLEAIGWASKPGSDLIFPRTGSGIPLLPRSEANRRSGLANMLRSDRFQTSALMIPGGQKEDAIPVVFIHGLMSTPDMWEGVVRDLRSDAEIAERYQFWFFYYPTGQPIPLSALQLRETLDQAKEEGRIRRPLVLVGHSMGGILARSQAVSLKPAAAESILPGVSSLPDDQMVRRSLIFPARSDVGRLVFIATPHRGTDFAYRGISRLGHFLIRLPDWLKAEVDVLRERLPDFGGRRLPTSIAGLSPGSPFLHVISEAKVSAPVHSIIPLIDRAGDAVATDGVVPFESSRFPSAASELVVAGDHGAFDAPESLRELHRILRLHAGLDPASPAP